MSKKTSSFVQDVLKLAEKNGIQLFTEYGNLCVKEKESTDSYSKFTDFVNLPTMENDEATIFGVDYNSMSLEQLKALAKAKQKKS